MRLCLDHHAFILFLVQIVVSPDGNSYKFNRRDSDGAYADPFYAYPQCILKQPCESQTQQGMLSALYLPPSTSDWAIDLLFSGSTSCKMGRDIDLLIASDTLAPAKGTCAQQE